MQASASAGAGAACYCASRSNTKLYKIIFLCCILFIVMSNIILPLTLNGKKPALVPRVAGTLRNVRLFTARNKTTDIFIDAIKSNNSNKKYILLWTSPRNYPFAYLERKNYAFVKRRCRYTNCHVVTRRDHINTLRYDVVAFAASELDTLLAGELPQKRSPHQKYVFSSIESGENYPLCSSRWNGYFNWTWTFRLDSDSRWGYIIVRDAKNRIIGPSNEMHWIRHEDMEPVSDRFKRSMLIKNKAAVWFASNCYTLSYREDYVMGLQDELKKYNFTVDVYGKCGFLSCERNIQKVCDKLIERDYYFYLAFENSLYVDYVTEKVLLGLRNNAVPIVFGGANYTRFMPDGIYLDASRMTTTELASKMNELIHNIDEYAEYFRWRKYYSFHPKNEVPETDDYCGFCALLNDQEKVQQTSVYDNLSKWWDPPNNSNVCAYYLSYK